MVKSWHIDYVLHVVPTIALNALMIGCRNIASSSKGLKTIIIL